MDSPSSADAPAAPGNPLPEASWKSGWWEDAFLWKPSPSHERGHPRGKNLMLIIIAYDISDPKRLKQVADCCKDFGIRAQNSLFECHLEADRLETLWKRLCALTDPSVDRLVAYPIHGRAQREIRCHGTMITYKPAISYQF